MSRPRLPGFERLCSITTGVKTTQSHTRDQTGRSVEGLPRDSTALLYKQGLLGLASRNGFGLGSSPSRQVLHFDGGGTFGITALYERQIWTAAVFSRHVWAEMTA